MQLQVKLQKTTEITSLQADKEETKYHLTCLDFWTYEKRYNSCFEDQTKDESEILRF